MVKSCCCIAQLRSNLQIFSPKVCRRKDLKNLEKNLVLYIAIASRRSEEVYSYKAMHYTKPTDF
ncbi:uncharacterized protein G2W53_003406 [Senna tora]|uniref:Uncharacterized protein n=1 Tax=Senna tora TaxID=362788 RepID=A0A834XDD3_9FABA|nr:uncharacterized protein G2W53_003406 [Senna tora]